MVPTLRVVTQSGTLRRPEPQSGLVCIPIYALGTRSVTAIKLRRQWNRRSGPCPRYLRDDCRVAARSARAWPAPTRLNL